MANKTLVRTMFDPCSVCMVVGTVKFFSDGTHDFLCRCNHPEMAFSSYGITTVPLTPKIKLRPYSETIKENMSKEDLIGWIVELEAEVIEATDLALERAAAVSDGYVGCGAISNKIRALKSKP